MARRALFALAALLLAASVVSAVDLNLVQRAESLLADTPFSSGTSDLLSWLTTHEHDNKDPGGAIIFRYTVLPGRAKDFVEAFIEHKNKTFEEESGVRMMSLQKDATDNIIFHAYAEWESKDAFMKHLEADYTKEFIKDIAELDVGVDATPTIKLAQESGKGWKGSHITCEAADADSMDSHKKRRHHGWADEHGVFRMAVRYLVPPSQFKAWEDKIREVSKMVGEKEEKNRIYSVQKSMTDNYESILYGEWDSLDAYWEHIDHEHTKELFEFNQKHKVMWHLKPMIKITSDCKKGHDSL